MFTDEALWRHGFCCPVWKEGQEIGGLESLAKQVLQHSLVHLRAKRGRDYLSSLVDLREGIRQHEWEGCKTCISMDIQKSACNHISHYTHNTENSS